ncbi:uncharacterized protein LOC116413280 [Galleria mellonella]|uniref:Uncharacterized protein LOC116413280 n=1 Tax=Galleria mellonella TaxID=7137 RepID=A0A6J3C6F8_GALME|nr:uncharacterized protein LOC116413280 [Galleria mellonella]
MTERERSGSPDSDIQAAGSDSEGNESLYDYSPPMSPCCITLIMNALKSKRSVTNNRETDEGGNNPSTSHITENIPLRVPNSLPVHNPSTKRSTPDRRDASTNYDSDSIAHKTTRQNQSTFANFWRRCILINLCCFSTSTSSTESPQPSNERRRSSRKYYVCPCRCNCTVASITCINNENNTSFRERNLDISWHQYSDGRRQLTSVYSRSQAIMPPRTARFCLQLSNYPTFKTSFFTQAWLLHYVIRFPGFLGLHPATYRDDAVIVEYSTDEQVRNALLGLDGLRISSNRVLRASYIHISEDYE